MVHHGLGTTLVIIPGWFRSHTKKPSNSFFSFVNTVKDSETNYFDILQVYLGKEGAYDIDGNELPRLVYVSREKRPGYAHHKKAGAMNAMVSEQENK